RRESRATLFPYTPLFRSLTVMLLGMARLEAAEPVSIGVLAPRGEAQAFAHLQPTLEQLNRALAGYQFSAIPLDLDALETVVAEGDRKSTRLNSSHVKISY